jgi:hypothetical protein
LVRLRSCLVLALVLTGCRVDVAADVEQTVHPVAGVDQLVGPTVDLGRVPTVSGGDALLTASANAAGGLCLDVDGTFQSPQCFPEESLADPEEPEIVSSEWDAGRVCVHAIAPHDVSVLSVHDGETAALLVELRGLKASDELKWRLFVGCYEDEPPLGSQVLRTDGA